MANCERIFESNFLDIVAEIKRKNPLKIETCHVKKAGRLVLYTISTFLCAEISACGL